MRASQAMSTYRKTVYIATKMTALRATTASGPSGVERARDAPSIIVRAIRYNSATNPPKPIFVQIQMNELCGMNALNSKTLMSGNGYGRRNA